MLAIMLVSFIASCGKKGDPTLKSFEKPLPVKEIKAVHREDEIILSWAYPASERKKIKGFHIEKAEIKSQESEVRSQEFKNISFLGNDAAQFIDKDFKIGQQYLYKVRVRSSRDIIGDDSPVLKVMPRNLPQPPSGLTYKITNDAVEITWTARKGVMYEIYKEYEKGKLPSSPLNKASLKEPFFKDRIEPERTVYYAVRASLGTDIKDEGYLSEYIEIKPDYFIPSRPSGLRHVISGQKVYLTWDGNPETWVRGYRIYRKKAVESDFRLIGDSVMPAFADNEQLTGRTIYYITAVSPAREGIASDHMEIYPLRER
ncbi:MAG: hypothetical protein QMD01_01150 [Thermodesulfovibrionales bacterium]|nr:hypothetical protein [Thermodesulfovibrionales bacterium]